MAHDMLYSVSYRRTQCLLNGISSTTLRDGFINKVKRELQKDIIPWQPESLIKVVILAKLFEEKNAPSRKRTVKQFQYTTNIHAITHPTLPMDSSIGIAGKITFAISSPN